MVKVLVVIDINNRTKEEVQADFFPHGNDVISVDEAYLKEDREDNSFYEFEFKGFVEE